MGNLVLKHDFQIKTSEFIYHFFVRRKRFSPKWGFLFERLSRRLLTRIEYASLSSPRATSRR